MGKASRVKKEKAIKEIEKRTMDPKMIEAYVKGRNIGEYNGKIDGYAEAITKFHIWTEEIDQRVKGIGPGTKRLIEEYFASRIEETIKKN